MILSRALLPACLLFSCALPATAASFDCAKAGTPFEHAICDVPALSAADEVLAKSFATATGGLTKPALETMRAEQRDWLDYAQRVCTDDAEKLTCGRYDEQGGECLVTKFQARSKALEQSRMLGGHRFLIKSVYGALPDPDAADDSESFFKVASHELALAQLDGDEALAEAFNAYVVEESTSLSAAMGIEGAVSTELDAFADTSVSVVPKEVAGTSRITLEANTYWYGHGAAHGNWGITQLNYNIDAQRGVLASDIFTGAHWDKVLTDLAWKRLQSEHGEWLQVESPADIAGAVIDPTRWDLSDDHGLIIQFQPYEVAAYAYGAPTITVPWSELDAIKAEGQDRLRYGW
ncbi:DUF3298 domain-containing protein [Devosia sp. A369]